MATPEGATARGVHPSQEGDAAEVPSYSRNRSTDNVPVATPSPFRYVEKLAQMQAAERDVDSFRFETKPTSEPQTTEIDDFPFVTKDGPRTTHVPSLKFWSDEKPVPKSNSRATFEQRTELTNADSFVLNPHPEKLCHDMSMSDSLVETAREEVGDLERRQSLPLPPRRARIRSWRLRKRRSKRSDMSDGGTAESRDLKTVGEASPASSSKNIFTWTNKTDAAQTNNKAPSKRLPSMPAMDAPAEESPDSAPVPVVERESGSVDWTARFSPLVGISHKLPRVAFPRMTLGRQYKLDPWSNRDATEFNGHWKVLTGAKELYKAQASLPEWRKLQHRFDGPLRFLLLNSTSHLFRLATWTAMVHHQDQRPWSGEPVISVRNSKCAPEIKKTVRLKGTIIEARTSWEGPRGGSMLEVYKLSRDRVALTVTVTIEHNTTAPSGDAASAPNIHQLLCRRL